MKLVLWKSAWKDQKFKLFKPQKKITENRSGHIYIASEFYILMSKT